MKFKNIIYQQKKHVTTITINRPEVRNCINHETNLELQHAWKQFRDDDDAFVAIFTGAGDKAFSAGWDLNDEPMTSFASRCITVKATAATPKNLTSLNRLSLR